jgi:hypothetical protein
LKSFFSSWNRTLIRASAAFLFAWSSPAFFSWSSETPMIAMRSSASAAWFWRPMPGKL